MQLSFEITKENKKSFLAALSDAVGEKAEYQGVPSFAYKCGDYTLDKLGVLRFSDELGCKSGEVIDSLVCAGFEPKEWNMAEVNENLEKGAEMPEKEEENGAIGELHIALVKDSFTEEQLENLLKIVESKRELIRLAFGNADVEVKETEIEFQFFDEMETADARTYLKFVGAIGEMAKTQKRINAKQKEIVNPKYEFRCFLLRLGFIGDEYKEDRKILLKNLEGSSAFKTGKAGE